MIEVEPLPSKKKTKEQAINPSATKSKAKNTEPVQKTEVYEIKPSSKDKESSKVDAN